LPSQPAKRPLLVDQPSVKEEQQAEYPPPRLIGINFEKMIAVQEKRRKAGEQEDHSRKGRHDKRGQPKPPLATPKPI
jgi:hypothetical protein